MIAKLLGEPMPDVNKTEEIKEDQPSQQVAQDQIKNPNRLLGIYHTRIELYFMQQRMECSSLMYEQGLETAEKLITFQR